MELAVLASVCSALVAGGVGFFAGYTYAAKRLAAVTTDMLTQVIYGPGPTTTVDSAVSSGHVHEATMANPNGWFCECGLHKHIYLKSGLCQCGESGAPGTKEWAE